MILPRDLITFCIRSISKKILMTHANTFLKDEIKLLVNFIHVNYFIFAGGSTRIEELLLKAVNGGIICHSF